MSIRAQKGWKSGADMSSYGAMSQQFITQQDLAPVLAGEPRARRAFYEQFCRLAWKAAYSVRVNGTAVSQEDIYGRLWVHLFEHDCRVLRLFNGQAKVSTYLTTVFARHALDIARSDSRERKNAPRVDGAGPGQGAHECIDLHLDQVVAEYRPQSVERVLGRREFARVLNSVLGRLADKYRRFFVMSWVENADNALLMETFGLCSENAVYQWKSRILDRMRKIFLDDFGMQLADFEF